MRVAAIAFALVAVASVSSAPIPDHARGSNEEASPHVSVLESRDKTPVEVLEQVVKLGNVEKNVEEAATNAGTTLSKSNSLEKSASLYAKLDEPEPIYFTASEKRRMKRQRLLRGIAMGTLVVGGGLTLVATPWWIKVGFSSHKKAGDNSGKREFLGRLREENNNARQN